MRSELASRLLNSIETDSLVILGGAGISRALPSRVPGAAELAAQIRSKYSTINGSAAASLLPDGLEHLAEYFFHRGELRNILVRGLIDWRPFKTKPNPGHFALADFLSAGIVESVVTTNVDYLVEVAAGSLGEGDMRPALDGDEAAAGGTVHKPYLKLHGCCVRDINETLWCKNQLTESYWISSMTSSSSWIAGNWRAKDILIIGFWSDWAYLNEALMHCLGLTEPRAVIVVDPEEGDRLAAKAPVLSDWTHRWNFFHERSLGSDFLNDLQQLFSARFMQRFLEAAQETYEAWSGPRIAVLPEPYAGMSAGDLYDLRRDAEGAPNSSVARQKRPAAWMATGGATHLLLLAVGAVLEGPVFMFRENRIRVLGGAGKTLSLVQKMFVAAETPPGSFTMAICAGAEDDGGVPPNFLRSGTTPTVVRPGIPAEWVTIATARTKLGI
jgi:hypothetical protein